MFTEKQWDDCDAKMRTNYYRVLTSVWGESARDRAEKFLDSRKPAMVMSGDTIIAPASKDVSRQELMDLLAGEGG